MDGCHMVRMEEGVRKANYILILGSAEYKKHAEIANSGVAYELGRILRQRHSKIGCDQN